MASSSLPSVPAPTKEPPLLAETRQVRVFASDAACARQVVFGLDGIPAAGLARLVALIQADPELAPYLQVPTFKPLLETRREPLLDASNDRDLILPIQNDKPWKLYTGLRDTFWTANEIQFEDDAQHFERLEPAMRKGIKLVLAFFAIADDIVASNLGSNLATEIVHTEANYFVAMQWANELQHAETYGLSLLTLVQDTDERRVLLDNMRELEGVRQKADWAARHRDPLHYSLGHRIAAYLMVEGVFFSSSFAVLLYLRTLSLMPGVVQSNLLIMRDETRHCMFGSWMLKNLSAKERPTQEEMEDIAASAVAAEFAYVDSVWGEGVPGLTGVMLKDYVRYQVDTWLVDAGYAKMYHAENTCVWMNSQGLQKVVNTFERAGVVYRTSTDTTPMATVMDEVRDALAGWSHWDATLQKASGCV